LNAVAAPIGDTGEAITAVRHLAVRSGAETRFFKTSRVLAHLPAASAPPPATARPDPDRPVRAQHRTSQLGAQNWHICAPRRPAAVRTSGTKIRQELGGRGFGHAQVPQCWMALIVPFARVARSTKRSMPHHGDHRMPATERHRRQRLDMPELRQAGDVVDLDYPPFFIDPVEDAVPLRPQAPQIRRPARARLRRPRPIGEPADNAPERSDTAARATTWCRGGWTTAPVRYPVPSHPPAGRPCLRARRRHLRVRESGCARAKLTDP
jgi:hypothetical protein